MITQAELEELLEYESESGFFRWKKDRGGYARKGTIAGTDAGTSIQINIAGKLYKAHRLAYLYVTGEWPLNVLDHKDGDYRNNKWGNLREATQAQNLCNTRIRCNNKSGAKGVSYYRRDGTWQAILGIGGKKIGLGRYATVAQAKSAYDLAAYLYHGEFARFN